MPKVAVFEYGRQRGRKDRACSDAVFGIEPNVAVMHDVVKTIWQTSVRAHSPP